jgi:hypothetical protein
MYRDFSHINDLIERVRFDKNIIGSQASALNRYPIRFVLFDNFRDSFEFVSTMQTEFSCLVEHVNDWIEEPDIDSILTYSKLANKVDNFIRNDAKKSNDYVITPFSELARFYDNEHAFEFNALISTIKGIESGQIATSFNQRIYIPIVGLWGKFSRFANDSQIEVWYFKNNDRQLNYRLTITNGTSYNVRGLDDKYTVVHNMQEWLIVWKDKNAKQEIISLSPSIFAHEKYAQPDNAFTFCSCHNVFEFLTTGLQLDFGLISYKPEDEEHWIRLASEIDVADFSFESFFNKYFHIDDLADYNVFLKTWFDCKDTFEKWLLCTYYSQRFCQKGYICQVIRNTRSYANNDFFASVALSIFDNDTGEVDIEERLVCLQQASKNKVTLTNEVQSELSNKLKSLAQQKGYATAIRYFSPLADEEKKLAILWLGEGVVARDDIREFFPDLYHYLSKSNDTGESKTKWVLDYIDMYKRVKISNMYSDAVKGAIEDKNGSPVTFNSWYQDFKTTKTILNSRSDIEVYYWIDGLGIDWIPYITELLSKEDNMHLNEVHIARATLPTTTSVNKTSLLELSNNALKKIGDLDNHAHRQGNKYPDSIIEEIDIVKSSIQKIINEYAGKKIAIVSDHGLSALAQLTAGLNLAGIESDHHGRFARPVSGKNTMSNDYIVVDNGDTICALRHESLCGKVPYGQSAHGGCTPEEVLVPLFVISSQPDATSYSVSLLSKEISGSSPVIRYRITGMTGNVIPYIMYNEKRYELSYDVDNVYVSDSLNLIVNKQMIELHIGNHVESAKININLGAEEDDLFNF